MTADKPDPLPDSEPVDSPEDDKDETFLVGNDDETVSQLDAALRQIRNCPEAHFAEEAACQRMVETLQRLPSGTPTFKLRTIDQYELLSLLGKGGMGEVYKARHQRMDKLFAVKLLSPRLAGFPEIVQRFEREVQAASRLDHENIVQAINAGDDNGTPYLVMEFVDGISVSEFLKQRGQLEIPEACDIILQAAAGLSHAHENGLIHRDVKPSNLIIDSTGRVRLLDMGLACFNERRADETELTHDGQVMGTPDYMSPEQLRDSRSVDTRTDIYSLGATFYKLLTGRAPFADEEHPTPTSRIMAVGNEDITPLRTVRPNVPPELGMLVHRMLTKSPRDRIQSAGDVLAQLEAFTGRVPQTLPRRSALLVAMIVAPILALAVVISLRDPQFGAVEVVVPDEIADVVKVIAHRAEDATDKFELEIGKETRVKVGTLVIRIEGVDAATYELEQSQITITTSDSARVIVRRRPASDVEWPQRQPKRHALYFDGIGDHIEIETLKEVGAPVTLETWVTPASLKQGHIIWIGAPDWITLELCDERFQFGVARSSRVLTSVIRTNRKAHIGERVHVAATWDGKTTRVFLDGVDVSEQTDSPQFKWNATKRVAIGTSAPAPNGKPIPRFHGKIDNVRISTSIRYTGTFAPDNSFMPDDETLLLYTMDESKGEVLTDVSGNGHAGRVRGAEWVLEDDNFLSFDGIDDYVEIPSVILSRSAPVTFEVILTSRSAGQQGILWAGHPNWVVLEVSRLGGYLFSQIDDESRIHCARTQETNARLDERVHVAGVWDGVHTYVYVNGKESTFFRPDNDNKGWESVGPFTIGAFGENGKPNLFFHGDIHAVRLSNGAIYTEDFVPPTELIKSDGTLAVYEFRQGVGNVLVDGSGNNHHGTIVGAEWHSLEVEAD